jgi:FkbM family methyltransferase
MLLDLKSLKEKYNLNITGVIHVGAHHGQENTVYNELNIENRIFFEPLKDSFEILKNNVSEQYTLYNFALGSENKKVTMNVERNNQSQSSSILVPKLHLTQYPNIIFNETEEVNMVRLDDVNFDLNKYNFIMIDVQGYELEVFKGAEKTLQKIDYIMSEINRDELYENCAKIEELEVFLGHFGFKLVEENWAGGTWGDGFFIKKDKLNNV